MRVGPADPCTLTTHALYLVVAQGCKRIPSLCPQIRVAFVRQGQPRHTVLVYMDETYCHQHHMPSKAWQEDDNAEGAVRCERVRSRGKMLIILHALSKDGLMFKTDRQGRRPEPGEWEGGKILNTEMIFQSKKAKGDYHENMDGDMHVLKVAQ